MASWVPNSERGRYEDGIFIGAALEKYRQDLAEGWVVPHVYYLLESYPEWPDFNHRSRELNWYEDKVPNMGRMRGKLREAAASGAPFRKYVPDDWPGWAKYGF